MKRLFVILAASAMLVSGEASWYWPFGSDGDDGDEPRLSELMEPATDLIDEASDLASEGRTSEAVEKYRAALKELDGIERENPDRVKKPEFATLRTKRAYVSAAIDSLLMTQARDNAKPVAVSDTAELEKRLDEERNGKKAKDKDKKKAVKEKTKEEAEDLDEVTPVKEDNLEDEEEEVKPKPKPKAKPQAKAQEVEEVDDPDLTPSERIIRQIAKKQYSAAADAIAIMLNDKPNDAAGLNLKAALEASKGEWREAERTLDQAIMSNPRSHFAYYNMAKLLIRTNPDNKSGAKRYYETGRALGGAVDAELEEMLQ